MILIKRVWCWFALTPPSYFAMMQRHDAQGEKMTEDRLRLEALIWRLGTLPFLTIVSQHTLMRGVAKDGLERAIDDVEREIRSLSGKRW